MADPDSPALRGRAVWTSDTGECTACGTAFPLQEPRYVLGDEGSGRGGDRRVFRSRTCATSSRDG